MKWGNEGGRGYGTSGSVGRRKAKRKTPKSGTARGLRKAADVYNAAAKKRREAITGKAKAVGVGLSPHARPLPAVVAERPERGESATRSQLRNIAKAQDQHTFNAQMDAWAKSRGFSLPVAGSKTTAPAVAAPAVQPKVAKPKAEPTVFTFVRTGTTANGDKIAYACKTEAGYIGNLYLMLDRPSLTVTIS